MGGGHEKVTQLLAKARSGDEKAFRKLLPLVYEELRSLAASCMRRERKDHTLQPTALVNEAYLRLAKSEQPDWKDRRHFLAIAANCMRRILVEHARARKARKRQGEWGRIPLDEGILEGRCEIDVLEIEEALGILAAHDPRLVKVVELRFFAGLSVEETAQVLDVDPRTVKRDWRVARTVLLDVLDGSKDPEGA